MRVTKTILVIFAAAVLGTAGCGSEPTAQNPSVAAVEVLTGEEDTDVRRAAALRLATTTQLPPDVVDDLLQLVKNPTEDEVVRTRLVRALGRAPRDRAGEVADQLNEMFDLEPSKNVKTAIVEAVTQLNP